MTALIALPGFPIQKSSGHSSFDNSPKLIAVYYVFHRLSAPRHPPCALYSLIIHPTPSKPKPHKAGISLDCLNLSILRHLMFGLNLHSIAHFSLYRFLLFGFQIALRMSSIPLVRRAYTRIDVFCQIKSKKNTSKVKQSLFQCHYREETKYPIRNSEFGIRNKRCVH